MSTLEDKLLGEKLHYYCSSSEDDDDGKDSANEGTDDEPSSASGKDYSPPSHSRWDGCSVNTGPKGVIKDWQRFKQIEAEQQHDDQRERELLINKLSLSCEPSPNSDRQVEKEFEELLEENDPFLKEYMRRRMQEMMASQQSIHAFGKLNKLTSGDEFLDAVDKKNRNVTVICHVFSRGIPGCDAMNGCLACLAEDYPHVKFCCVESGAVGMSKHFSNRGVPALLIYKNGHLIGNFVRLTKELGEDFFATDVEAFLVEHGFLPDPSLIPDIVKNN